MERFISSASINLIFQVIKKMDIVSFVRMSQTCRKVHEFMENHLSKFNISTNKELIFDFPIDPNDDWDSDETRPSYILIHGNVHCHVGFSLYNFLNSVEAVEVMRKFAFVKFHRVSFTMDFGFLDDTHYEPFYENRIRQLFNIFEANQMKSDNIVMWNGKMIEEAIRIFKPKKISCHLIAGEIIKINRPALLSTVEEFNTESGDLDNLLNDVVPHCKKATLETNGWQIGYFMQPLQKVIQRSVHNEELTIRLFNADFEPNNFLNILSKLSNAVKIPVNSSITIFLTRLENSISENLIVFFCHSESAYLASVGYFTASTMQDILERRFGFYTTLKDEIKPDVIMQMAYFDQYLGIKLPVKNPAQCCYTAKIPLHLTFEIIKKMDLVSFTRMNRTCKKMHEFIKIFLQEFSIDCDMELKFDIISDDYRKSVAENKNTPIPDSHDINLSILSPEPRFQLTFNSSQAREVLKEFSFVNFSKVTFFRDPMNTLGPLGGKLSLVLTALRVNRMATNTINAHGDNMIEDVIQVLKPKKLYCSIIDEEVHWPSLPRLWYALEKVSFYDCHASILMCKVVPFCRKVEITANFLQQWGERDSFMFVTLLKRVLMSNCVNTEFDGYFPVIPHKILESLSTFYYRKLQLMSQNFLNSVFILPMASNVPACLIIFISSHFDDDFGSTRIQYFLANSWTDVISRKMYTFNQSDMKITKIFSEADLSTLMEFFETEINN